MLLPWNVVVYAHINIMKLNELHKYIYCNDQLKFIVQICNCFCGQFHVNIVWHARIAHVLNKMYKYNAILYKVILETKGRVLCTCVILYKYCTRHMNRKCHFVYTKLPGFLNSLKRYLLMQCRNGEIPGLLQGLLFHHDYILLFCPLGYHYNRKR